MAGYITCVSTHRPPVSRRAFLGALGSAAAVAGFGPPLHAAAARRGSFRFIVVNDLHHGSAACDAFLAALVGHMRDQGPVEFCLIVGDLADQGRAESLRAVREAFAALGVPIHPVPGNHDCDQEENTGLYEDVFPGRLNYHFNVSNWQFLALDSTHGNKWGDTEIQPAMIGWLDAALPTLDRRRPTVLFTHFPLAPVADARLTPTNAADLVARFDGWNLRCAFSGHYHARTEAAHGDGVLLTNPCCARLRDNHDGTIPEGYLVCTAHENGALDREFVRFTPAENSGES